MGSSDPSERAPKRRRVAIPSSLNHLESVDFSHCDPAILSSILFRLDYAEHGALTYQQCRSRTYAPKPPPQQQPSPPSWSRGDLRALASYLAGDRSVASLWARDLVGVGPGKVRPCPGLLEELFLVGKEYPLRSVCLVGLVVAIESKEKEIKYHCAPF